MSCQSDVPESVKFTMDKITHDIDFNFHVKPILSDKCYKCHGPDEKERKAELRLDIKSNNLKHKDWVTRIVSEDSDILMPPPDSHLKLSENEKAILIKWINQGAKYQDHWSFSSPHMPEIPTVRSDDWSTQDIDKFILSKLQQAKLKPKAAADKQTLIKRVFFDLTGLPPTPEDIDQFLSNQSDTAYENLIDRLLASPHYGEQMALDWLDVSRYADTHGYQDDGMRTTWPWRDWVIKAHNENLSYKDFIIWQLAGDLLENPTNDQLLATCFNRNHPQTQEGGIVDEEYRVEYVADRTNTFGKALIGLTTECARCHDHKYDPISQKDYYSLYAFFNNNNESGIVPYNGEASPTILLPTPEAKQKIDSLEQAINMIEEILISDNYKEDFEQWYITIDTKIDFPSSYKLLADFSFEEESLADKWSMNLDRNKSAHKKRRSSLVHSFYNLAKKKQDASIVGDSTFRPKIVNAHDGKGLQFNGDGGIRFNRDLDIDRNDEFTISIWFRLLEDGIAGPIFNNSNGDFEGYRGWLCKLNKDRTLSFQLNHVWPDNAIDLQTTEKIPVNEWIHIAMTYDGSSQSSGVGTYINGTETSNKIHADKLYKSLLHGVNKTNWSNMPFQLGMELRKSITQVEMDELKVYNRSLSQKEIQNQYTGISNISSSHLSKDELFNYYLENDLNQDYSKNKQRYIDTKGELNLVLTNEKEVMVMQERKHVRPTYILNRGVYDQTTSEVRPSIPDIFSHLTDTKPQNRLELAEWLFDESHPLTARVAVNRIWMKLFGKGIVATQEDFGNQGNLPTHPKLLDFLATSYMDMEWDTKAFIKMIMLSSTYRLSSLPTKKAKEIDPQNILYSHFPAYRLSAENIRDAALAGAGLLVRKIGGPSVYPYQPPGLWKALATRNATKYVQQSGDSLYRRSMYTVWKRSSPPPSMMTFDAPDRYYCVVQRQKTSTPLQSLILMNDPQYLEASKVLAENLVKMENSNLENRLNYAAKSLLARPLSSFEQQSFSEQYDEFKQLFATQPEKIKPWIENGEYQVSDNIDQAELAVYTVIASTMMNFDEFIMKK